MNVASPTLSALPAAVLFDFDGTLANYAALVMGVRKLIVGKLISQCYPPIIEPDYDLPSEEFLKKTYGDTVPRDVMHTAIVTAWEEFAPQLQPGVLETLHYLKDRHIPFGIISNTPQDVLEKAVRRTEIGKHFPNIFLRGLVKNKEDALKAETETQWKQARKPYFVGLQRAYYDLMHKEAKENKKSLERLEVVPLTSDTILYIGDTFVHDIHASHMAGWTPVHIDPDKPVKGVSLERRYVKDSQCVESDGRGIPHISISKLADLEDVIQHFGVWRDRLEAMKPWREYWAEVVKPGVNYEGLGPLP